MSKKSPPSPTIATAPSYSTSSSSLYRTTSPENSEIRPPNLTRRPVPGNPQPPPPNPTDAAPDYNSIGSPNIILPNALPAITDDCSPPWYTWGDKEYDRTPTPPLFSAIFTEDESEIQRLISQDPDIVNTKDQRDRTPLYCAVVAYQNHIGIVRLLLESGAEVDEWSTEYLEQNPRLRSRHRLRSSSKHLEETMRTPLMAACQRNHLPIVRLLISPPYCADPKLVAPDGQHALRLASAAGAREIVTLLPSVRAGGWKRFKHRCRPHIEKIKRTGKSMYEVGKFIIWETPRFFVWTLPKFLATEFWKFMKWFGRELLSETKRFGRFLSKVPAKLHRFSMWFPAAMGRFLAALVKAVVSGVKKSPQVVWKLLSVTLPEFLRAILRLLRNVVKFSYKALVEIVKWVWNIITVRLPKVSLMVFKALVAGVKKMGGYTVTLLSTIASLLHTFFSFIMRQCTWENVVQGIKHTLKFFMGIPVAVWDALVATYKLCYKVVNGLFGAIGWFFWKLGECLLRCALWFPRMIGRVIVSFGKILGSALSEIRLWIDPKAKV